MTRSAIDALGRRLARAAVPAPEDLRLLAELQGEFVVALEQLGSLLRPYAGVTFGDLTKKKTLSATDRVKTPPTLIEKLRRGTRLSSMQDIVGFRLKGDMSLIRQDEATQWRIRPFDDSRVIDRRAAPSHGYRAVHLIVSVDGFDIEIQIRTAFKDIWANSTEQLGDVWGRWLRYGLPAEGPTEAIRKARAEVVRLNIEFADATAALETLFAKGLRDATDSDPNVFEEDLEFTGRRLDEALGRFAEARDRTLIM